MCRIEVGELHYICKKKTTELSHERSQSQPHAGQPLYRGEVRQVRTPLEPLWPRWRDPLHFRMERRAQSLQQGSPQGIQAAAQKVRGID